MLNTIMGFKGDRKRLLELIDAPGTMAERRWEHLPWLLPETALRPAWWLTNPDPDDESAATPKFLCKSLGILRGELHRSRVATVPKLLAEQQRRKELNDLTRKQLAGNPEWLRAAGEVQKRILSEPTASGIEGLLSWAAAAKEVHSTSPADAEDDAELRRDSLLGWDEAERPLLYHRHCFCQHVCPTHIPAGRW